MNNAAAIYFKEEFDQTTEMLPPLPLSLAG
jgi:hypothetical protein